jgi:hypothetical protein
MWQVTFIKYSPDKFGEEGEEIITKLYKKIPIWATGTTRREVLNIEFISLES